MSLIYRISRAFYLDFNLDGPNVDMEFYQIEVRKFIFGRLRGFVSVQDFADLEFALFNNFSFILQRMWSFRGFRLAGVNRMACEGWFGAWSNLGYSFDISGFTDWSLGGTLVIGGAVWDWASFGLDASSFVVAAPKFNWGAYFTGARLSLFKFFGRFNFSADFALRWYQAINGIPAGIGSRFELEWYFIRTLVGADGYARGEWKYGYIFDQADFKQILIELTGSDSIEVISFLAF